MGRYGNADKSLAPSALNAVLLLRDGTRREWDVSGISPRVRKQLSTLLSPEDYAISRNSQPFASGESREINLRRCDLLWPYRPAPFSAMYSRIILRACDGSFWDANIRLTTAAVRPEFL